MMLYLLTIHRLPQDINLTGDRLRSITGERGFAKLRRTGPVVGGNSGKLAA